MIGSRIVLVLMGALIGAVFGLLIGLWAVSEQEDALALGTGFWGAVIGGLVGVAVGWAVGVVRWRTPNR